MNSLKSPKLHLIVAALLLFAVTFIACSSNVPETVSSPVTVITPELSATPVPTVLGAEIVPISTQSPGIPINLVAETPTPLNTSEPKAAPTPEDKPTPSVTEIKKERYCVDTDMHTVAWISDTQHYANTFPEIYPTITSFLYEHREEMNLVYVVHTGDLVHQNGNKTNWARASEAMSLLRDIPYGVLAGNHDMVQSDGNTTHFSEHFGEAFFADRPWYGESYLDNRCHYDLITIGQQNYIFVYVSFKSDDKGLQFAKEAFEKYSDRIGILCVHEFMTSEGVISKDGKRIREKIISKCPNCYLVLCGHRYGLYCLEDSFDDDGDGITERTVYEMMMNYQSAGKEGGSGYFRLMQFDDKASKIRILTYSPYLDDYNWLDDPAHKETNYMMGPESEEFTLDMPWRK